jgi:ABC-type xylose transport system substrate-binding protein
MSKKTEHMGMTMMEEEQERWRREQAEVMPEQQEALMKQMGISAEADREWHKAKE